MMRVRRTLIKNFDISTSGVELHIIPKRFRTEEHSQVLVAKTSHLAKAEDLEVLKTLASNLVGKLLVDTSAGAEVAEEDGALRILA